MSAGARSLGLADPTPLTLGPQRNTRDFLLFPEIRFAVNQELLKATAGCRELLAARRSAVESVTKTLLVHGRIDGLEVARLLEQCLATERQGRRWDRESTPREAEAKE